MKVLVLTNMYPTRTAPGDGAFVEEQVESLRALGLSIEVLTIEGQRGAKKYLGGAAALRRAVRRQRFDLIHAHYGLSGAIACSQRRIPIVTTFHGSDVGYVRWQGHISWVVARITTPIFVTQEGAARVGIAGASVIPCGVDTARFRPMDRREARRLLGWKETGRYVLLPGPRRQQVKRSDLFDAAVEQARLEVADLVSVSLEHAPRAEVALIMNAVDVTLLTSDSEGSPVAIKEALACSTPVVSVPVGDVPRLIEGLPGCAVAPRSPEALGRAVVGALGTNRSLELRERVMPYANELIAERVALVYQRVIDAPALIRPDSPEVRGSGTRRHVFPCRRR
jgi:glycosyltransferase involved in cell wall biosynthesis